MKTLNWVPVLALAAFCTLNACDTHTPSTVSDGAVSTAETAQDSTAHATLADILAAQSEDVQARFKYRNPEATLKFFGIKPGMTVVEALPNTGWYSKIIIPYLGPEGTLIGADYSLELWPKFFFIDEAFIEKRRTWTETWVEEAKAWVENGSHVKAFVFGNLPEEMAGTADAVLFIRALHNLNRYEQAFLDDALSNSYSLLKSGGIFGVVQHRSPESYPDDWADGSKGYLKQSYVIQKIEAAGFELVKQSEINANLEDQPTTEEFVWRLSPSLETSRDNPELRAKMKAIGESDRMTLLFRKP